MRLQSVVLLKQMLVSEQIGTRSRRYAVNIGETRASIESMAEDTVSIPPSHIHFTLDGNRSPLLPIKKRSFSLLFLFSPSVYRIPIQQSVAHEIIDGYCDKSVIILYINRSHLGWDVYNQSPVDYLVFVPIVG